MKVPEEAHERARFLREYIRYHGTESLGLQADLDALLRNEGITLGTVVTVALAYFQRSINPRAMEPVGNRRSQVARRKRATRRR